jgi:hypothetical protein
MVLRIDDRFTGGGKDLRFVRASVAQDACDLKKKRGNAAIAWERQTGFNLEPVRSLLN